MVYTKLFRKKYLWVLLLAFVLIAVIAYYFFGHEVEGATGNPVKVCVKRNKKDKVVETPCSKKGVVIGTCLSDKYLDKPEVVNCKEKNKMLGWCTKNETITKNDGSNVETSNLEDCTYEKNSGLWRGKNNYSFFNPSLNSEVSFSFDKNIMNNPNTQEKYDRAKKYLENIDIDDTIKFYRRGPNGRYFMANGEKIQFTGIVKNISYVLGKEFVVQNSNDIETIELTDFNQTNKMLPVNVKFKDEDTIHETLLSNIIYKIKITGKNVENPRNNVTGQDIKLPMSDIDVIFDNDTSEITVNYSKKLNEIDENIQTI